MNRTRVPVIVSAVLLCLPLGCEKDKSAEPSATSATAQPIAASAAAAAHSRGMMRPGMGFDRRALGWWNDPASMLMHSALQDPTLTDEQRDKIDALRKTSPDAMGAMPAPMGEFRKMLSDAVKAGKIDEKAFEPQLAAMQKAGEEARAARAKRLDDLHAILTPEQRKTAADMIRKRLEAGLPPMAPPAGSSSAPMGSAGPHQHPMPPPGGSAGPRPGPMGAAGPQHRGPMEGAMKEHHFAGPLGWMMMSRGLNLTDDQQKKVDALERKAEKAMPAKENLAAMREQFKTNMLALLDAFEKDTFDTSTLAIFKAPEKPAGEWMKAHLEMLSSFVAILTQEQRDQLAERIAKPGDEWRRMDPGGPRPDYWSSHEEDEPGK